jgi:hypothetical protein
MGNRWDEGWVRAQELDRLKTRVADLSGELRKAQQAALDAALAEPDAICSAKDNEAALERVANRVKPGQVKGLLPEPDATREPYTLAELFAQFAAKQRPLDADMAAIINANLDSLYITDEPAAALAEPVHIHTCPPDCQKPLCVNRRREIAAAVEAEREACAQVAEAWDADHTDTNYGLCIGNAIRERGSK